MNGLAQYIGSLLQSDSLQFTISQIIKMTGVSGSQLRYWEHKGLIKSQQGKKNQNHTFPFMMVLRIATIKYYLDQGYTLQAASSQEEAHRYLAKTYHQFFDNQEFEIVEDKKTGPQIVLGEVAEKPNYQLYMTIKGGKTQLHLRQKP